MLSAGIQAEFGLDPRLKHSGVTGLESHLFAPAAIFEGGREEHEVKRFESINFRILRVLRAAPLKIGVVGLPPVALGTCAMSF